VDLIVIRYEFFVGQEHLHLITLALDLLDSLHQVDFFIEDLMIQAILKQRGDIHHLPAMVLHLSVALLYLFLRVNEVLHQLLHPFCYYPQDSARFHKEYAVTDLLLTIFCSILRYLPSNQVLCKGFDLILIYQVLMG
jgi:hypothetical protein